MIKVTKNNQAIYSTFQLRLTISTFITKVGEAAGLYCSTKWSLDFAWSTINFDFGFKGLAGRQPERSRITGSVVLRGII
jgi:hypothetical protein